MAGRKSPTVVVNNTDLKKKKKTTAGMSVWSVIAQEKWWRGGKMWGL